MKNVYIYRAYERFWHWSQALIIFLLIFTGFEIHGSFEFFGYKEAAEYHRIAGVAFIVLSLFTIFWHFTTGEWKHYVPTLKNLTAQANYYLFGIFKNAPHPVRKTLISKLNPLQRIVYFGLKVILIPLLTVTGLLYMFFRYSYKGNIERLHMHDLEGVAILHTIGAFLIVVFLIAHLYLITTGHTPLSHLKAMLTGFEELEEDEIGVVGGNKTDGKEKDAKK
jgi:thiosulfate reductase cytochrome b subunit